MFDQPFFTLGKGYIFELQCEKFEYSGEDFTTGIDKVDNVQNRRAYFELELDLRRVAPVPSNSTKRWRSSTSQPATIA
jgi:hypothetical protein